MKNKGFTLIELLAVIVVLAIVLIIAVPRVLRVIEDSEKESFRISGENLLKGVKDKALIDSMTGVPTKTYTIEDGAFVDESISISGNLPNEGTINVRSDGKISLVGKYEKYCIRKGYEDDKVTVDTDVHGCSILPTPVSCFTYTKTSTEVTITDYSDDTSCPRNVGIPSKIEGLPVKTIGSGAFARNQLTRVTIPSSVITIKNWAFLTNLIVDIAIPTSVTNIEYGILNGNRLPDDQAFIYKRNADGSEDKTTIVSYGGLNKDNIAIPSTVTTIENQAFAYDSIRSIILPDNLKNIGDLAFYGNQLTNITIPTSVTHIGIAAFNANKLVDSQAFIYKRNSNGSEDKTFLVSYGGARKDDIVIPSTITTLGPRSMAYVYASEIVIPSNVTNIQYSAFSYNYLTKVTIPSNVTIESNAISLTFYTEYVTNNSRAGGIYTAPSQTGTWTKQ